jgi:hypothetical protein
MTRCSNRWTSRARDAGFASILSLSVVVVVAATAVTLVVGTTSQLHQTDNLAKVHEARLTGESGVSFLAYQIAGAPVQSGLDARGVTLALATHLRGRLDGTANLSRVGGRIVHDPNLPDLNDPNDHRDPNLIQIPSITLGSTKNFSARIHLQNPAEPNDPFTFRLEVTGRAGLMARTVGLEFEVGAAGDGESSPGSQGVFGFPGGIVSNGPIALTGNAKLRSVNDANESSLLTTTMTNPGITLNGNCTIDGDAYLCNPAGAVSMAGNYSLGGATRTRGDINAHIHKGVSPPELPRVDTSIFKPLATTVVTGGSSGNLTYNNILVRANTNPTFAGNTKIRGIVYIEQPNNVHFAGNCDLKGLVVTEDAGDNGYTSNSVKFSGNFKVAGIDALPNEAQFAALKAMPGSFILAPGFSLEFAGNFGTVAGYIAANQLKFTGNISGTVYGGIINYGNTQMTLTGNSTLTFNRQGYLNNVGGKIITPPGFVPTTATCTIQVKPNSYFEQ